MKTPTSNIPTIGPLYADDLHYKPISTTLSGSAQANIVGSDVASFGADLYNGNIRAMQTTLTHPGTYQVMPQANAYEYDQLNRLKSSRSFTNLSANNWQAGSVYSNRYFNTFEYDAMGNILTQKRHKQDGTQIEDMTYRYQRDANGFLLSNRLYHVNDAIDSTIDATDIDDQGAGFNPLNVNINGAYNYVYDEEGRLIKDKAEDIQQIVWRVDGKVKEINRSTGSTMARLKFDYDAMGRRIAKHVYNNQTGLLEKSTYYLLDAQGNTMATYDYAQAPNQTMSFQLKERHIYGSTRLGMYAEPVVLIEHPSAETNNTVVNQGFKYYEMTNHLGNVLTVIHDIKIPLNNGTDPAVSSYRVGIRNTTDYSPFGVELDGRTVSLEGYRFGYQGSEKDNEFKGQGNSYTTEFRQLDPRLGRWLTIDPLFAKFPWQSSYTSFDNNPILLIDHLGTETESGPGDGYTKNKDGTRSKTNANGTKTYDAPGFSSVTLPANAKVIGTMQDVDGKIDGAIHNNGVRYQATVGDLARFEINNVEYIAQFSSGTFIDFENDKGEKYYFSENKITNTIRQGDPLEFESYGNPKNGTIKIQQADAVGYQLEVGFAFVGGMSIYSGVIQDYTGKKLYYKGYSGNIGFGYGAGVNGFIVKSNTSNRFTVDEWLGNGEGFSGGFGPLSGGFGGTDGPDKYNVYSFGIAKGSANFWWAGTRTSSW